MFEFFGLYSLHITGDILPDAGFCLCHFAENQLITGNALAGQDTAL